MSWTPLTEQNDKILILGIPSPGIASIEGVQLIRDFQVTDYIVGLSGGYVRFRGWKLTRFKIVFRLYTKRDWDDYYAIWPTLSALPVGKNNKSFSIDHPIFKAAGIESCVFEKLALPVQDGTDGCWKVELDCIEFRKPKYQLSELDAAKATPVDPIDQEIDQDVDGIKERVAKLAAI